MNKVSPILHLCLLLLLFLNIGLADAYAQRERIKNQPYSDYRSYYLGFGIGASLLDIRLQNAGLQLPSGSSLYASTPSYGTGFSVSLIGGKVLVPNWELRLMPTLHIGERLISYSDGEKTETTIHLRSNTIELPLQIKYTALRLNNIRPYIGAGVYGAIDLGSERGADLRYRPIDMGLNLSIGCDFYLRYFKLCPELRFSYGLSNSIRKDRPDLSDDPRLRFTQAVSQGRNRMILLTLNFE